MGELGRTCEKARAPVDSGHKRWPCKTTAQRGRSRVRKPTPLRTGRALATGRGLCRKRVALNSAERARTLHALAGDLRRQRGPDGLPARRADRGPPRRASSPGSIDVDEAARMLTVVMSGLISLQLANEPGVPYSAGRFSSLTAAAADMYLTHPRARLRASRRWLAAATAPAVGARASKWSTRSPGTGRGRTPRGDGVRAAPPLRHQPDRAFAGTLVWSYEVEPDGEGTLLTESHEVTRPVGRIGWLVIERLFGAHDRSSDRRGIANPGRAQGDGRGPAPDRVGR